jgi:MFS family permease
MRTIGLLIAVMFMGSTLLTPLFPLYEHEFGFSDVTLTLVYATYVVGNLGALLLLGRLSDQLGRRRVSLTAVTLGALASLIFLFAVSTPWLFAGRVLSGAANGVVAAAATAWAIELIEDRERASVLATTANMLGVAAGPLLAGVFAHLLPAPLRTVFVVHLLLVAYVAWLTARLPETVRVPMRRWYDASYEPRIGVPPDLRAGFVAPAACGFATFALGGYYAALVPAWMAQALELTNPIAGGAVVAALYVIAAVAIVATRSMGNRRALLGGLLLLLPAAGLLLCAQLAASLPALLGATLFGGLALALGYRGSLAVINRLAPATRRAELIASFMLVCFVGNALPVIGLAVLSRFAGPHVAYPVFAAVIALLAVLGLFAVRHRRRLEPSPTPDSPPPAA